MILTCWYPCVFLYAHNIEESPFTSMFPFFGIFFANALIFFLVFLVILRKTAPAAFLADLAMLLVINFTLIFDTLTKGMEWLTPLHLVIVGGVILLLLLVLLLWKKPSMKAGCLLVSIAFGALILVSFASAAVTSLIGAAKAPSQEALDSYEPQNLKGERPNVYFFLFDGYAGPENLMHYYDYDNSPFIESLEDRGFTVSRDSYNTESLLTVTLIPNLMNMDYVAKDSMRTADKNALLVMPNLFRTFADNGYQLNLINHLNYFGTEGCNVLSHKQSRRTISDYLLKNSLYSQFKTLKKWMNSLIQADYVATYTGPLFDAMEAGLSCWEHVGPEPTFTLGYIQCPHAPTILDREGNLVENYENVGWHWDRPELYLGQLEFVSRYIEKLVDNIQAHDPNALILLQSDHGCRQAVHYYNMKIWDTYDAASENLYMQNTLNCVYYRGESFDIAGKSGINTIRTVMNQVFGTSYEEIEPIYYTKGEFDKKK